MLKWEELSNNEWTAKTEFGYLRVDDGRIDVISGPVTYLAYWDWDDPDEIAYCVTVDEAKAACEADYARRVTEIAAANGYVKVASKTILVNCDRCGGSGIQFFDGLPNAACSYCGGKGHYPVERDVPIPNGYVKADDYEALQKRLDELVNFIDGLDEDAIAVKAGYVKLEPGQVVVQVQDLKVLQGWASYGNWNPEDNEDGPAFDRIRAALDASGVGR